MHPEVCSGAYQPLDPCSEVRKSHDGTGRLMIRPASWGVAGVVTFAGLLMLMAILDIAPWRRIRKEGMNLLHGKVNRGFCCSGQAQDLGSSRVRRVSATPVRSVTVL